jgi:uncharacterized damage-inducible protein DinB
MNSQHYLMFADYNAWANHRLYHAVATLSDDEYREDAGVFFKSAHATLNHLLVTDRIWMSRFTGEQGAPDRLDAILFDTLPSLREAREKQDAKISEYIALLNDADLMGVIKYRRVSTPESQVQVLWHALAHWFNHQTHHRGQVHAILTRLGRAAPDLDLLIFQRLALANPVHPRWVARLAV